ncbi:MAG: DNA-directed RNA polymerase subunit omega [Spirochaetaceae bacterium]|nr:MAG: DNA-directed RNA polymerase subunit omega [Spirochaetaceae bacterium]
MYIMTCAAIKRVLQLSVAGDEEVYKHHGKIVSVAIKQILEKRIEYKLEE